MASQFPPRRILVIDDNHDAADLTAQVLELHGHVTMASYGGEHGVRTAIDFAPDVVLLDLGMPGMDGFAVAAVLRVALYLHQPMIVAYSAWNDLETIERALSSGFDRHLIKPAKVDIILDMLAAPLPPQQ